MADQTSPGDPSDRFHFYGLWAVVAGLATLLLVVLILVLVVKNFASGEATAILGAIASPVVAIVSAYFGISVSASAQSKIKDTGDQALAAQKDSSNKALAAGLMANPTDPTTTTSLNALISRLVPGSPESGQTGG